MKTFALRLYQVLQTESRPLWIRLLQWLITFCVLFFVWHRLSQENWREWYSQLPQSGWQQFYLVLVLLLMPLNLGLETRKWQCLIHPYYPQIHFRQLFTAVLTGLATGIFTPNRIGEYAGRVMSLPAGFRLEAGTHTLVNRLLQMLATLLAGMLGASWLWLTGRGEIVEDLFLTPRSGNILLLAGWLITGGVWVLLLRPALWLHWLRLDLPFIHRMKTALSGLEKKRLYQSLGWALLRYTTFSLQYLLLLYAFGYENTPLLALSLIGLTFLLKSLLPSVALTELGVRESVALWVMGGLGLGAFTVVSSTFLLYLVNVIVPALMGLGFINRLR